MNFKVFFALTPWRTSQQDFSWRMIELLPLFQTAPSTKTCNPGSESEDQYFRPSLLASPQCLDAIQLNIVHNKLDKIKLLILLMVILCGSSLPTLTTTMHSLYFPSSRSLTTASRISTGEKHGPSYTYPP